MKTSKELLVIPAQLEGYRSLKDRSVKLSFETGEPSPEQMASIQSALMKAGYLAFQSDPFTDEQRDALKDIKVDYEDTEKTPSKRLRAVLFVMWKQNDQGYEIFNDFYIHYMEKFINHIKAKLDPIDE